MKKLSYLLLVAIVLLSATTQAAAQMVTVSGFVIDSVSGTPLEGANIYLRADKFGETTLKDGSFSFRVQKGRRVELSVSFVGYTTQTRKLTVTKDTQLKIALVQDNRLPDVKVYASRRNFGVRSSQMSAIDVPIEQVKALPALFGEVDVMKALQKLPGVQPSGEGNAGILVRGGKYDQNLIMLDGGTLYNAEHLKGFVSALNADMIERLSFYKGAFPARYGSRVSSILDIGIKEGDFDSYHTEVGVGLLSSRVHIEGPIFKGKTSFNVSARMSYFDALVQPMLEEIYDKPDAMKPYTKMNYYDINAKIVHKFSERDKLSAVLYLGKDISDAAPTNSRQTYKTSEFGESRGSFLADNSKNNSTDNSWGNTVSSLFWTHSFSEKFSMNANLSFSRYNYKLKMSNAENKKVTEPDNAAHPGLLYYLFDEDSYATYRSGINDYGAAVDFYFLPDKNHSLRWGTKFSLQHLTPVVDVYKNTIEKKIINGTATSAQPAYKEIRKLVDTTLGHNRDLKTISLYVEDDWSLSERWKANIGAHYSLYLVEGKSYHSIEPRLSLRYLLTDKMSLKASYTRMSQGIHLLSSSNLVMPSDIWVPATENIPITKSDQWAAGVNYDLGKGVELSAEGYWKLTDNTLDYKEGSSYMTAQGDWESLVAVGKGKAYGVELFLQKKTGRTNGWVSYTWSKSLRKYDRPGQEISGGRTFYDGNDRRNNINVAIFHRFNEHWEISASWSYMTGKRGIISTTAMYGGIMEEFDPFEQIMSGWAPYWMAITNPGSDGGSAYFQQYCRYYTYSERNGFKLPDSHHLDIGLNYSAKLPNGELGIGLTIYNIYNRQNISYAYLGYDKGDNVIKGVCMFPFMPSLSLSLKF